MAVFSLVKNRISCLLYDAYFSHQWYQKITKCYTFCPNRSCNFLSQKANLDNMHKKLFPYVVIYFVKNYYYTACNRTSKLPL